MFYILCFIKSNFITIYFQKQKCVKYKLGETFSSTHIVLDNQLVCIN